MTGIAEMEKLGTDEQIEEAKASLDRINGWINSCDSKAGTVLALTGVLLTIIFTNDGMTEIYNVLQDITPPVNFGAVLYIGFLGISVFVLCYGIARLILTLVARIDANVFRQPGLITDSVLFFGSISNRASYQIFQNDILSIKKEDYLKDLLSQIYINSKIANEKHVNYNEGIKWTIIGFIAFEAMLQNAFMQMIRHFEKIFEIPCEELPFWIISIVKNEARAILRKNRRTVSLEDWDGFAEHIDDISGYTELVDLFTQLPKTYRSVLELKMLHGYTDKEIAKRVGISETAVSSRATRGRTLLREIVEKEGFCV